MAVSHNKRLSLITTFSRFVSVGMINTILHWGLSYYNSSSFEIYYYEETVNNFIETEKTLAEKVKEKEGNAIKDSESKTVQPGETLHFIDSHCSKETRKRIRSLFILSEIDIESYRRIKIYSAKMLYLYQPAIEIVDID